MRPLSTRPPPTPVPTVNITRCSRTMRSPSVASADRKSTRLNSSHTNIYTLSLHDALPISAVDAPVEHEAAAHAGPDREHHEVLADDAVAFRGLGRSEEHTSELQSHQYLHSFPTRRSSDLRGRCPR